MNSRLFAILIVFCLAIVGGGCSLIGEKPPKEETKKPPKEEVAKPQREILLPKQTGSNFERRIILDDESSLKETQKPVPSKTPAKKKVKAEPTEPAEAEPEKPKKSETPKPTTPVPDRFR